MLSRNIFKLKNFFQVRNQHNFNLISYDDFENVLKKSTKANIGKIKSDLVKSLYQTDLNLIKFYDENTVRYYRDLKAFEIVEEKKKIYTLLNHIANTD